MKKAYFVLAVDQNYIVQCNVTITSIIVNLNKEYSPVFFVFLRGISEKPTLFVDLEKKYPGITITCYFSDTLTEFFEGVDTKSYNHACHQVAVDRLLMFKILPDEVEKAIYLDSDLVVNGDLIPLIENFKDKIFGCVADIFVLKFFNIVKKTYKKYGVFEKCVSDRYKYCYFNAGFYIANIKKCKELNIFEQLKEQFGLHPSLPLYDQDFLNLVFSQNNNELIEYIPLKYNLYSDAHYHSYMCGNYYYSKEMKKEGFKHPIVMHYAGFHKPWDDNLTLNFISEWWKYYELSAHTGWKRNKFRLPIYHFIRKLLF